MNTRMLTSLLFRVAIFSMLISACNSPVLLKWNPESFSDNSDVEIICDASQGNKDLLNYPGDVFVHLGVITDKSKNKDDWQYVKFKWGSREPEAKTIPAGKNKWKYKIKNIRNFFQVPNDEQIKSIAVLFRSGACIDIYCKVLRNSDGSNMYIPVTYEPSVTNK